MSMGAREEDRDQIVASLESLLQAVLGNVLESMRQSVNDLDVKTGRRIDALREGAKEGLDALRTELLAADENVKRDTVAAVETQFNFVSEQTESQLENVRRELDQRLKEAEDQLRKEHFAISERLDGAERGLVDQAATSGRMNDFLDTLGHVLVRDHAPRQTATTASEPAVHADAGPGPNHDSTPIEVEVPMAEPPNPSVIETQPLPLGSATPIETDDIEDMLDRVDLTAPTPHTPD